MMYLRPHELVFLYATEWLMVGLYGLIAVGVVFALDAVVSRLRWRIPGGSIARVGFAVVIAIALFFGTLAWITTFRHSPPSLRPWLGLLVGAITCAAVGSACGLFKAELEETANLARFLSLVGAATLLSLPFIEARSPPAAVPSQDVTKGVRSAQPNIVLITIDTLAASHLTPYGYSRQTSPEIEKFASQATVVERFYADSNFTTAGVASILTGQEPWSHRVLQHPAHASRESIQDSFPAHLHEQGYLTAYFGSNPWAGARFQGYGKYFDFKNSDVDWVFGPCFDQLSEYIPYVCAAASNRLISYSYSAAIHAAATMGLIKLDPHSDLPAMIGRATRWCETIRKQRKPVFLWVHLFPPHDPYAAPAPWLGMFDASSVAANPVDSHPALHFESQFDSPGRKRALEARYDESIAYVDHYVGQLIANVHQNLGDNTAILLTADHGESFNHGYGSHGGVMLYEDLIHIPMIIELPGAKPSRQHELASQVDIAPTIAAVAGIERSAKWVGRSLVDPVPDATDRTQFSMNFEENGNHDPLEIGSVAALKSNWKFVQFFGKPNYPHVPALQDQLFDLKADPTEQVNLKSVEPEIAAQLSSEIRSELARHGAGVAE